MKARASTLAVALAVSASLAGCQEDKSGPTSPPAQPSGSVVLTPYQTSIVANGSNTVSISVTDTSNATVDLSTNRGTFDPSGLTTARVVGGSGSVTLRTCNATVGGCAGIATVTARSAGGYTSTTTITFGSLASVCPADCSADAGCVGQACDLAAGGSGTCSSSLPSTCVAAAACTPTASTETSCTDGADNDCSGDTDCEDDACDARPCPGGPAFFCKTGRCTDITSGLAVVVTPLRTRLPAVVGASTVVEVEVTADAEAASSMAVSIAATPFGTLSPLTGVTGTDGKARFTFTNAATVGTTTITATLTAIPTVKGTATITVPRFGALELVEDAPGSAQYPVMGVTGSGWREYGWIQVKAIDDLGLPYPDGLPVRFEHRPLGGSTFAPPLVASPACTAFPGCVAFDGLVSSGAEVDTTGLANAWVYTGRVAGTLPFVATATAGGVTRSVSLPTIATVGAKASGANFAIVCSPRNLPALAEHNCAISLVDAPFTCEAILKDRFNNVLGRDTQVEFISEAAAVGQIATTPAYDPAGAGQMDLGIAVQGFNTLGAALPFDVAPITTIGEPSVSHGFDGCGTRTHNPRDGVVTIVAIADGEEAFFDANGDGTYAVGESFVDQGEPFVDQNDNGIYDGGEWFLDADGSGGWTAPNGAWDAATKIWTQTVVLYTGDARTVPGGGGNLLGTRIANDAAAFDACNATSVAPSFDVLSDTTVHAATSKTYALVASDMNLNFLNTQSAYGVEATGPVELEYSGLSKYADVLGFFYRYWPCDGAGNCASQCRATSGNASCVMQPSLASFSCGLDVKVTVTGGTDSGAARVDWNVDVPWNVYGGGRLLRDQSTVSGIVRP